MQLALDLLLLWCVLLVSGESIRRWRALSWFTFTALPILMLPWWIFHSNQPVYYWIKLNSVIWPGTYASALRFTRLRTKKWAYWLGYLLLLLNITEVVIEESQARGIPHLLNIVAGILLLITLPGQRSMRIATDSRFCDLIWDIPLRWIIGYTLWNWTFIYLYFPENAGRGLATVMAPLVVALFRSDLWVQARLFSLAIYLMLYFTFARFSTEINTASWSNPSIAISASVVSCVWMLFVTSGWLNKKLQRKSSGRTSEEPASVR